MKHSYVPFADFVRVRRRRPSHARIKIGHRWIMAYDILKEGAYPAALSPRLSNRIQDTVRRRPSIREEPGFLPQQEVARQDRFLRQKRTLLTPARSPMKLLTAFLSHRRRLQGVFPQQRTYQRRVRQALGSLTLFGAGVVFADHLDQRGPTPVAGVRSIFLPLPLPMGTATVIPSRFSSALCPLPTTVGRVGPG